MSEPATQSDVDDLERMVIILGGVVIGLSIIVIIVVAISFVCVSRIFKRLKDIAFVTKNTRLDVRKVLDTFETAVKRNPAALMIDVDDGSERVSPIFTRRMFTPSPLPFDFSVLHESEEFSYDRNSNRRTNNVPVISSNSRKTKQGGGPPVVPPRRAHSFYGHGDY